jgi:hypothetical protein
MEMAYRFLSGLENVPQVYDGGETGGSLCQIWVPENLNNEFSYPLWDFPGKNNTKIDVREVQDAVSLAGIQ